MGKTVDYYFTAPSPWTYLGHGRFGEILKKHGAAVNVKPVDYGRIFPVSGGLPLPKRPPQRQAYRLAELKRFRDHLGVPINIQPKFHPVGGDPAALLVIAADSAHGPDRAMQVALACMRACWLEERNIAEEATIADIAAAQGLTVELTGEPAAAAAKAKYDAYTQEAIERSVFGAPSYVVDGEIFWGQDRLEFLDRALAR